MTVKRYSYAQMTLHWLIFLLFAWNWIFSDGMGRALHQKIDGTAFSGFVPDTHPWIGVAVLALTLIRLVFRQAHGRPDRPQESPAIFHVIGEWGHVVLYALLLLIPIAGILAWWFEISWMGDVHAFLANAGAVVAGLHAAAAVFHQVYLKDHLLERMLPGS